MVSSKLDLLMTKQLETKEAEPPFYRDEHESKHPEDICATMLIQGVLPKDCPLNRFVSLTPRKRLTL
jgi:hypothetical protein